MRWVLPRHRRVLLLGLAAVVANALRGRRRDRAAVASSPRPVPPAASWPATPRVSVLIAAWNEAANVDALVRSFLALDYPDRQLLLCAGGGDDTYARAQRWAGPTVTVHEQRPGEGKQAALRRVLPEADGEIVLLTDADCELNEAAFLRLVAPLAAGEAAVATGAAEPKPAQRDDPLVQYQWFVDREWYARRPPQVEGILGRNTALRRDVLAAIGGFDPPVRTGTDYVMGRLLTLSRYEIRSVPDSRVATEYPATADAYLRMWRRWNKNLLLHGPRFGAWGDVRGVLTAAALGAAVLGAPALAPLLGPFALVLPTLAVAQATAGRVGRVVGGARLAGMPVSSGLLVRLPLYALLDMAAVVLAVADAARPSARGRW